MCEEVHLNLGYRWVCRLGPDGDGLDHSTFSKTRHGRFGDADLLRALLETVVRRCMAEGLVGGEGFAVAVEPSTVVRQAEVSAAKTMIERTHGRFELWPERLIADTGCGAAAMRDWLVNDRGIEPHIPVFDKSRRTDDTFPRADFVYDHAGDTCRCPAGKTLRRYRRQFTVPRIGVMKGNARRYRASKHDGAPCPLKSRCCPNAPVRKVPRSIDKGARDLAREIAKTEGCQTSRHQRQKVEMLFAHLKHILSATAQGRHGPCGARDEFHLAAAAQNLRKLAKLVPGPQTIPAHQAGANNPLRLQGRRRCPRVYR